jgi:hypothetical protein
VDTAAPSSMVENRVAERLHLERNEKVEIVSYDHTKVAEVTYLPDFRFGPIQATGLPVLRGDLSSFVNLLGVGIDVIVGMDMLSRHNFAINFERQAFSFARAVGCEYYVPFQTIMKLVAVDVRLGEYKALLAIDTGARELALFHDCTGAGAEGMEIQGAYRVRHFSGESTFPHGRLSRLEMGSCKWKDLPAVALGSVKGTFVSLDGVLPLSCLRLKLVYLDFERHMLGWTR